VALSDHKVSVNQGGQTIRTGAVVGGAPYAEGITSDDAQGTADVWEVPAAGWQSMICCAVTPTKVLTSLDPDPHDHLGASVDINDKNTVIVAGAPHNDVGVKANQGSASVFVKPMGLGWGSASETSRLYETAGTAAGIDNFGLTIAVDSEGDTVVVGAPYAESAGGGSGQVNDEGNVFVFEKPGTGWPATMNQTQTVQSGTAEVTGDAFGQAVAIDAAGTRLVVGIPNDAGAYDGTVEVFNG
jgi:hypothetical protein